MSASEIAGEDCTRHHASGIIQGRVRDSARQSRWGHFADGGKIRGGNSAFTYVGDFQQTGHAVVCTETARRHNVAGAATAMHDSCPARGDERVGTLDTPRERCERKQLRCRGVGQTIDLINVTI